MERTSFTHENLLRTPYLICTNMYGNIQHRRSRLSNMVTAGSILNGKEVSATGNRIFILLIRSAVKTPTQTDYFDPLGREKGCTAGGSEEIEARVTVRGAILHG